jgi:DNA-binding response OmpR family regulator
MLTGETGADDIKAALEAGASSYVSKPYSPNALLTLVDTLLARG